MFLDNLKRKTGSKLQNNRGDSIAEVLVALLISALALVMLASMITSSSKMILSSKTKMNAYYSESSNYASPSADGGQVTITVDIDKGEDNPVKECGINYYKTSNDEISGFQKVVSFKKK